MNKIRQQTRRTVQSQVRQPGDNFSMGMLFNMALSGQLLSPWWSTQRDINLTKFAMESDHFQGAEWMISSKLTNVPFRVEARDRGVKRHQKLADEYQAVLENMIQFGQGWGDFWDRFYSDLWETDNGGFGEILSLGGNPGGVRKGPAIGLNHLDSLRCTRTGNPEFPVIYQDVSGKWFKFHHTRIIYQSQRSSGRADMHGVGHCWLSRSNNNVQQLVDQDVYYQEALGSRPVRQMLLTRGIDPENVMAAFKRGEESMDNQGLSRYAKTVVAGDPNRVDIGIDTIPFTFLPEGYDKQQQTSLAMFAIALAGGFPPRWLWPATAAGATKADAMFQHISGSGGGALWHLNMMRDLLSYTDRALALSSALPPKFIPKELRLVFDYQDDEQDRQQAEIKSTRASTRETDLNDGVITIRVAREQALSADDITEAQFNQMELEDGRLPDGADLLTLFDSADPLLIEMLDLGVDEPLLIDANDPIEMMIAIEAAALATQTRMVQARSGKERAKAEQALSALGKLKSVYEELVVKEIEEEIAAEQESGEFELPEGAAPEEPPGEGESAEAPEEETEVKAFQFGAKVGERIRGGLFRGAGGKFASDADISAIRSEILGRLIARLRGARAGGTGKGGAAKKPKKGGGGGGGKTKPDPTKLAREKLTAERQARAEIFGEDAATMEQLAEFIAGGDLDPAAAQGLAQQGFVRFDDAGNAVTTAAGRSVISAATKGDKRKVADITSKARESVAKVQARADKKRERATEARERADELIGRAETANADADDLDDDADELLAQANAEEDEGKAEKLRVRAEKIQVRAEKKREQAAGLQDRATEQDERAGELDTEAGQIEATIGAGEQPSGDEPPAPESETQQSDRDLLERLTDAPGSIKPADLERLREAGLIGDDNQFTDAGRELRNKAVGKKKELAQKSLAEFELGLTAAVTGLWDGTLTTITFLFAMRVILDRALTEAWEKGAADCGIKPNEMTDDERSALGSFINTQTIWATGFAADINANNQASGGELEPLLVRMQLWLLRYNEARERGKAMACADKKLKWILGRAEHCPSCIKLDGKVRRASWWNENEILPRVAGATYLECRGYNCQCRLVRTDAPLSRGRLPSLP